MINDIANMEIVALVFIGALLVFHSILVWPKNLNKKNWHYVEYCWLGIAFLGVIFLTGDSQRYLSKVEIVNAERYVKNTYNSFRNFYVDSPPGSVCRQHIRSEYSPKNFDDIVKNYEAVCQWFKQLPNTYPALDYKKIDLSRLSPPNTNDEHLNHTIKEVGMQLEYYNSAVAELEAAKKMSKVSGFESMLLVFWPFLFSVALALRITKVTGTLRHEN